MIERFDFSDLRELFAKANEQKSGDQLAGIAARSERERVAAKRKLADLTLEEIVRRPLIDPSEDDVTRLILETFDPQLFRSLGSMTVGEFREFLLDDGTTGTQLQQLQEAIIPEIAAAVAKLMSNKDLVLAAAKIRNVTRCRNTMGERGVLGIRVQPNHPPTRSLRKAAVWLISPLNWRRSSAGRRWTFFFNRWRAPKPPTTASGSP